LNRLRVGAQQPPASFPCRITEGYVRIKEDIVGSLERIIPRIPIANKTKLKAKSSERERRKETDRRGRRGSGSGWQVVATSDLLQSD